MQFIGVVGPRHVLSWLMSWNKLRCKDQVLQWVCHILSICDIIELNLLKLHYQICYLSIKQLAHPSQVAEASLTMACLHDLMIVDLKAFHETVPAFSQAKWGQVAHQFSLQVDKDVHQLKGFSVPCTFQLSSIHP